MDAGLDRISISVDGTDPVAFERERKGANFECIVRNIDLLINLRSKKGCNHPKVRIQTVKFTDLDLEAYKNYWSPRCDEVAAVDFKDVTDRDTEIVRTDWACPQLWQRMTIEWDGKIMPCNNDDFGLLSPGNVKERSICSCWHDPIVKKARELHHQGLSHQVDACRVCPWRTTQILKL
jgi:radical SAM protein with 4Fe4S-binding SPASM domain